MKFEVDFNHNIPNDYKILKELGAVLEDTGSTKYPPFEVFVIELESFEDLDKLLQKVNELTGSSRVLDYSAVVSFDPPAIFFDDKC